MHVVLSRIGSSGKPDHGTGFDPAHLVADESKQAAVEWLFGEIVSRAELFLVALAPFVELNGRVPEYSGAGTRDAGHERLLIKSLGYHPLWARVMTRLIYHWGKLFAAEINEGRRVRVIIDEIAKTKDCSALAVSRRAKKLRDECGNSDVQDLIDGAAQKAGLWSTTTEFNLLIDAACERDEAACRELGQMADSFGRLICLKSADVGFPWKPAFISSCKFT